MAVTDSDKDAALSAAADMEAELRRSSTARSTTPTPGELHFWKLYDDLRDALERAGALKDG